MPAFAFAPGGDRVAVVRYEAEKPLLDVWDIDTEKRVLADRLDVKGSCQQLLFSPDGKHVLLKLSPPEVGDTLTCWPVAPGAKPLWTVKLGEWAKQILVTPRGKVLSAHHGRTLKERDLLTGAASRSLRLPRVEGYHFLAVSSDDKLYEAQRDAVVEWDLTTGREVRRFPGGWGPVRITADGKSLVVNPGSVQRWDLATGRPAFPDETPLGHFDSVTSIRFTGDGERLVSAARDGSVAVWEASGGRPARRWRAQVGRLPSVIGFTRRDRGGVQALAVSADGRRALTAGYDEGDPLRLWDTAGGKELLSFAAPEAMTRGYLERVHSLHLGDGHTAFALLCSGSRGPGTEVTGRLMRWDLATGKVTADLPVERLVTWTSAVDPTGRLIATGDLVRDAGSGRVVAKLAEHDAEAPPGVAFSQCGALLGGCPTWRSDHDRFARRPLSLQVWEPWTGQVVAQLPGPRIVGEVVFHPDGRHVAVNDWDGVHVYDLRAKKRVKSFPTRRPAFPETFAFSPDGRTLATGHPDGTILLWDVTLPGPAQGPARPGELEALWRDLGGDAARAYRAAWRLADLPREAVPFLRDRVKPAAPASKATTAALLRDLDADDRPTRDKASAALRALGRAAETALRDALARPASAEQKRRVEQLLAALGSLTLTVEQIRDLRAAAVLGWAGTPDALAALRRLAGGTATDPLTRQAGASLARRAATVSR
jgi:WD40 repeat protein